MERDCCIVSNAARKWIEMQPLGWMFCWPIRCNENGLTEHKQ